uniref:Uncharacterized protein n=1 Tax=Rhizophora mucronata TaxID=61149 RepID=A0A2P2QQK8_RHIMU
MCPLWPTTRMSWIIISYKSLKSHGAI